METIVEERPATTDHPQHMETRWMLDPYQPSKRLADVSSDSFYRKKQRQAAS